MSFLVLDRVRKGFGKAEVIQDASLIVEKGETVAIVGPADGEALHICLRPHRLSVGGGGIKGRVLANFWLGDQSHLAVELARARIVAALDGAVDAPIGTEVTLGAPPASVHLFDGRTGAAILHAGAPA